MIDYARITVKAGDGGRGSGSFFHIKGKRHGKADGGDGGRGGDVYLEASLDLNTLETFRYNKDFMAQNGQSGGSNRRNGAQANDLILKVPVGTMVKVQAKARPLPGRHPKLRPSQTRLRPGLNQEAWDYAIENSLKGKGKEASMVRGLSEEAETLNLASLPAGKAGKPNRHLNTNPITYDLVEQSQKVLVARGGEGGRGNSHLRDEFGRRPKSGEAGQEGEECQLTLELKLIADVGLVGLPNAGKSTLLSALTKATPAIADYPFTTLEPNLGVMRAEAKARPSGRMPFRLKPLLGRHPKLRPSQTRLRPGLSQEGPTDLPSYGPKNLVIADIPGLIEGASAGKGLGDLFLRHIERTRVLVHLIDIAKGIDPIGDYKIIRLELKNYSIRLLRKKEIVVLNKVDLVDRTKLKNIKSGFEHLGLVPVAISAKEKIGLQELVRRIVLLLKRR